MDNYNEKTNESTQQQADGGCLTRYSKAVKMVVIGALILLLLIPVAMVQSLITERGKTQEEAIDEVSSKWSLAQTVSGPYLNQPYTDTVVQGNETQLVTKNLMLLPDRLDIDGQLSTEVLSRGIYDVNVYRSELTLKGTFGTDELKKNRGNLGRLQWDKAVICLNLTDMRGIGEQISITLGDSVYVFEPGMYGNSGLGNAGVHVVADLSGLEEQGSLPFEMKLKLKGSQSIQFVPLGKTTRVSLKGNWGTPSFTGNFLPTDREVGEKEFTAQWQVLNLNRNYSQVQADYEGTSVVQEIERSAFGVDLKIPVEQYQQSMRSAKYAILVIVLTFAVIFFTEVANKTRIHALQYLLVGLSLCLFYSLLLSFSEHIGFGPAYLVASVLTIALVGGYMFGIIHRKKPAFVMAGLLAVLYLYVFVLIGLETFALLAGSLGLFVILAVVMYFSKKIDWFNG